MQNQESQMPHMPVPPPKMPASSSRILYDIPCKVCRDHSSGKHYGIFACDGCAGFFKRSIRRNRQYVCKAKSEGGCMVDKTHRNQCRACRLAKCIQAGMNKDAVQHERGPRNSTLRRQMALYFKEPEIMSSMVAPPPTALDLVLPKAPSEPRVSVPGPSPHPSLPHPIYCNALTVSKIPSNIPNLQLPFIPSINPEAICEQAARLLFLNVHWARNLVSETNLVMEDQLTLLESSWRELFLLAAAQMIPTLDPTPLLPQNVLPQSISLMIEVNRFRETLAAVHAMNLDQHEFACIRAIVLFKAGLDSESVSSNRSTNSNSPSPGSRLRDAVSVARLMDSAQLALGQRLSGASYGTLRLNKLLLLLPTLRSVSAHAIEELFFRTTIGVIPIERIICDVYKAS
ncbi:nuclear receptor subfamily 2 group E member 1 [Monomorium pharaonis]|uniref:nuclear receptor subfamily 2 group E member 1 n=1 Tax=Monomorium pharaonis TaxID=307658 RepID=UPI00063F64D1|nr:nuclear receptor subfamily 2 group E member 1 [Monomorium pharaonis]